MDFGPASACSGTTSHRRQIRVTRALRSVVPMERIVFGTDYPFRTSLDHVTGLETGKVFDKAEIAAIYRGNVAKGLPALL